MPTRPTSSSTARCRCAPTASEVAQLGAGDIVGEAAILNHSLRTATIVALTPLELIHFTKEQLDQLNVEMPSFHEALEKTASERFPSSPDVSDDPVDLSGGLDAIEELLLGEAPHLTRVEVAEQAGVSLEVAQELWRLLGFAEQDDDDVAFTAGRRRRRCELHPRPDEARASSAPSGRRRWYAPGGAASPGWPSGRPGSSPRSPSRATTRWARSPR